MGNTCITGKKDGHEFDLIKGWYVVLHPGRSRGLSCGFYLRAIRKGRTIEHALSICNKRGFRIYTYQPGRPGT